MTPQQVQVCKAIRKTGATVIEYRNKHQHPLAWPFALTVLAEIVGPDCKSVAQVLDERCDEVIAALKARWPAYREASLRTIIPA